jgi:glucose/arabinose dehydrogenase
VRLALTALLALAGTLAACGAGGDSADRDGSVDQPAAPAATAGAESRTEAEPAQARGLRLVRIGTFSSPLYVTAPRGDRRRVFVVEQTGRIRVVRGGRVLQRPFLDLSRRIISGGEQGLLGLAFAPDYATTRRFYVNYTDRSGNTNVVEYRRSRRSADRADASTARRVLRIGQPAGNHNGGMLAFGPDRLLYIGTGDGGGANDQFGSRGNAQSLSTLLGKLLRIDPRPSGRRPYRVPTSNPFAGRAGARGEIYSYGLRNPWRFSFDRRTGDLTIGDVGQNAVEEVNFVPRPAGGGKGANFGWRPFEGTRRNIDEPAPGHVPPVLEHRHSSGFCSITGGYVVRDPDLPQLAGRYVYGDFCQSQIRSARVRAGGAQDDRALGLPAIQAVSSFGEDARGRVYVTSLSGPVHRIASR